jgi:hypothetical protein
VGSPFKSKKRGISVWSPITNKFTRISYGPASRKYHVNSSSTAELIDVLPARIRLVAARSRLTGGSPSPLSRISTTAHAQPSPPRQIQLDQAGTAQLVVGENDRRKLCPRPARLAVSARTQLRLTRGSPGGAGLTETLMPLELCEFCCAGATYLSDAGLRSRRHGRLCFGTEGLGEPEALHTENTSARGWKRPGTSLKARRDQGEILGCFSAEGAACCDTWPRRTCKGGTVQGRDKERRV